VRLDAYATDREAGKTGAIGHHRAEMIDRHGLGLGHAMDVDELRQHVLHALRFKVALGFLDRVEARRGHQLGRGGCGCCVQDRYSFWLWCGFHGPVMHRLGVGRCASGLMFLAEQHLCLK
jgi:hypothetical protein